MGIGALKDDGYIFVCPAAALLNNPFVGLSNMPYSYQSVTDLYKESISSKIC